MNEVSFPLAFFAGLISFVSPCVLPLIPGYVSFVTGISTDKKPDHFWQTLLPLILFVIGFTIIFTMMGASATLIGGTLKSNKVILSKIAGLIIIVFGLHISGLLKIKFLEKTNQSMLQKTNNSSSFVMGLAFAIGWTPCIGIYLGTILSLASTADTAMAGSSLLLVYSLGLGIPFIIFGQAFAVAKYRSDWLRTHTKTLNFIGGLSLVGMGILLFFGKLEEIAIFLQQVMPSNWNLF